MNDSVQRSDELDEKIANSTHIHALIAASQRTKVMIRLLAVSLALDVMLSLGFGWLALRAEMLAEQANSIEYQQYTACKSGNNARAGQLEVWDYLLNLPPTTPQTPAQKAQIQQVRGHLHGVLAPRRC
jgi:hypothetical protein